MIARVELAGQIDMLEAPALLRRVEDHVAAGAETVVFDFAELTFIDSSGLGVIVQTQRRVVTVIVNVNDHLRHLLEVVGLEDLIDPGDTP